VFVLFSSKESKRSIRTMFGRNEFRGQKQFTDLKIEDVKQNN